MWCGVAPQIVHDDEAQHLLVERRNGRKPHSWQPHGPGRMGPRGSVAESREEVVELIEYVRPKLIVLQKNVLGQLEDLSLISCGPVSGLSPLAVKTACLMAPMISRDCVCFVSSFARYMTLTFSSTLFAILLRIMKDVVL